MVDTTNIALGRGLLEMAIVFQDISKQVIETTTLMNSEIALMKEKSYYTVRNRENLEQVHYALQKPFTKPK